jgi:glycosyltransferase involved in cell wall biosynthesis
LKLIKKNKKTMAVKNNKFLLIITDLGSFNNFLSDLTYKMLDDKKYEIHVICSHNKVINNESKYDFNNELIKFHFVDIPRSFNLFKQFYSSYRINKIINDINPIITHIHFTTAIFTTLLFHFKRKKNTLIGTFHGLNSVPSSGVNKLIYKLIENYCFFKLNKIILINILDFNSISSFFSRKVSLLNSKGLGCDLTLFDRNNYSSVQIKDVKDKFNIKQEFTLAFIGRFVDFKGFDIAVKSFLKLSNKHENKFKLILIGGFDPVHSSGLNENEKKDFDNHKDIINIGFVSDIYNYLPMVDLLIFPSKREGLPIVATESLAMNVPVIAFDSRGTNELVINEFNGILISENSNKDYEIDCFVNHITILFQDKVKLGQLSKNTLLNREQLSRKNFIKNEINMYNNII